MASEIGTMEKNYAAAQNRQGINSWKVYGPRSTVFLRPPLTHSEYMDIYCTDIIIYTLIIKIKKSLHRRINRVQQRFRHNDGRSPCKPHTNARFFFFLKDLAGRCETRRTSTNYIGFIFYRVICNRVCVCMLSRPTLWIAAFQ